jgi:ribA/ribD-fused uncharacterized protein
MDQKRNPLVVKVWAAAECVVFHKVKEDFGGLSNMSNDFPLVVDGVAVRSSEALYQAAKFPHLPEVQRAIYEETRPMASKMRAKPHAARVRPDWEDVKVGTMRACLRVKLAQHPRRFGGLLLATGDRPIVERSHKDRFWGAVPVDDDALVGINLLGVLLMELREEVRAAAA